MILYISWGLLVIRHCTGSAVPRARSSISNSTEVNRDLAAIEFCSTRGPGLYCHPRDASSMIYCTKGDSDTDMALKAIRLPCSKKHVCRGQKKLYLFGESQHSSNDREIRLVDLVEQFPQCVAEAEIDFVAFCEDKIHEHLLKHRLTETQTISSSPSFAQERPQSLTVSQCNPFSVGRNQILDCSVTETGNEEILNVLKKLLPPVRQSDGSVSKRGWMLTDSASAEGVPIRPIQLPERAKRITYSMRKCAGTDECRQYDDSHTMGLSTLHGKYSEVSSCSCAHCVDKRDAHEPAAIWVDRYLRSQDDDDLCRSIFRQLS
jgi:hypothetical protein